LVVYYGDLHVSRGLRPTLGTAHHRRPGFLLAIALLIGGPALAGDPPIRPDMSLTPGAVFPVTAAEVCRPAMRNRCGTSPEGPKRWSIASTASRTFDPLPTRSHLISLGLGGSNDIRNLWPESLDTHPWNGRAKDRLEERLHKLVCKGALSLDEAQTAIASDWIAAYQKYVEER
jgi:hypothetical protein